MPTDLKYDDEIDVLDSEGYRTGTTIVQKEADMSCELKLNGFGDKSNIKRERANKNLHIFELAKFFSVFPSTVSGVQLKLLTPEKISKVEGLTSATPDIYSANIIATMNGPMAHLYIKGTDWRSEPDPVVLNAVISLLKTVLHDPIPETGKLRDLVDEHFVNLTQSIDKILVRKKTGEVTEPYIYEEVTKVYKLAGGVQIDTIPLAEQTGYIDMPTRVENLNSFNRSGDIILVMRDKTDGSVAGRYTTGAACKSWHGSLNPSDSYVPLILAYPGGNAAELTTTQAQVCTNNACKANWSMPELIKNIMKRQY